MSKKTLKPCKNEPCNRDIQIGDFMTVCTKCFMTEDETDHWHDMPREARRLASKYAKKRKKYFERMKMRENKV